MLEAQVLVRKAEHKKWVGVLMLGNAHVHTPGTL